MRYQVHGGTNDVLVDGVRLLPLEGCATSWICRDATDAQFMPGRRRREPAFIRSIVARFLDEAAESPRRRVTARLHPRPAGSRAVRGTMGPVTSRRGHGAADLKQSSRRSRFARRDRLCQNLRRRHDTNRKRSPCRGGRCGIPDNRFRRYVLSRVKLANAPGGASRLAALLLPYICPICSVVAPCHPGAALRIIGNSYAGQDIVSPLQAAARHVRARAAS